MSKFLTSMFKATISDKRCDRHPLPPYSVLVASLLAHSWSALPGTAFLGPTQQ